MSQRPDADDIAREAGLGALDRAPDPALGLLRLRELVDAVLAADDLDDTKAARRARSQAIAHFYASGGMNHAAAALRDERDATQAELHRIAGVHGMAGRVKEIQSQLLLRIKAQRQRAASQMPGEETIDALFQADLPPLPLPSGWEIDGGAIYRLKEVEGVLQRELVAPRPIVTTGALTDEDGTEYHVVEFQDRRGRWKRQSVRPSAIQDARGVISRLANYGAPIGSHNARLLSKFLFGLSESDRLPEAISTRQLGWLDDRQGFLWGSTMLTEQGSQPSDLRPAQWPTDRIHVELRAEEGDAQVVAGFHARGTMEAWRAAMNVHVVHHPVVLAMVYASLAAPFLGVLERVPNPIVDLSGETSHGKTTALRVAASVWGDPVERDQGSVIHSWRTTEARLERLFTQHRHLPLFLDDTKRAGSPQGIEDAVYMHAQGVGKGRARPDGSRATLRWNSVLISTGEAPINSYGGSGGANARALCIDAQPFGSDDNADVVHALTAAVSANYGHAGPAAVRWLIEHRNQWARLRARYTEIQSKWDELGRVEGRLGQTAALLEFGGVVLHDILGVKKPTDPVAPHLERWVTSSSATADRATAALNDVYGWAAARKTQFWGPHRTDRNGPVAPQQGWLGAWQEDDRWEWIAVLRPKLHDVLKEYGYHPQEVVRSWSERGWLMRGKSKANRNYTMVTKICDSRPHCYRILRSAIEEVA